MLQTIHISVDAAELIDSLQWDVARKDIGPHGARGTIGNDGVLALRINNHAIAFLQIHEDDRGKVVVDVRRPSDGLAIARFYPEDDGHVPPRPGKTRPPEKRYG